MLWPHTTEYVLPLLCCICLSTLFLSFGAAAESPSSVLARTLLVRPRDSQSIAQLGQSVEIACQVLHPADMVMLRLRKLPLVGQSGKISEVFAASMPGGKQRLHSPWDTRRDLVFNSTALSIRFNMTQSDEGLFRCDAVTLDGETPGNSIELLTAQEATAPVLLFDGASASKLEIIQETTLHVNCSANVGKPAGDLQLTFVSSKSRKLQVIPGAVNATWTGLFTLPGSARQVLTIFKSIAASVKIAEKHQNGTFVCRLTPSSLTLHLAHGSAANGTGAGGQHHQNLEAVSPPVQALFEVRNIRMEPFRENFFHGDSLTCQAEGRPAPTIEWSKIQGPANLPVNDSRLLMPSGTRPGYYSYTCSATNRVKGRNSQLLQSIGFNLHNRTAPPSPPTGSGGVGTRLQSWMVQHQHSLTIAVVCLASLAGLTLLAAMIFCACGGSNWCGLGGYNRLIGSGSGDAAGSHRERMRYYGELGNAAADGMSSDEDDEYHSQRVAGDGSRQLLDGKPAANGNSWNGTQV